MAIEAVHLASLCLHVVYHYSSVCISQLEEGLFLKLGGGVSGGGGSHCCITFRLIVHDLKVSDILGLCEEGLHYASLPRATPALLRHLLPVLFKYVRLNDMLRLC